MEIDDTKQFNKEIRKWGRDTKNVLLNDLNRLTRNGKMRLLKTVRSSHNNSLNNEYYGKNAAKKKDTPKASLAESLFVRTKKNFGEINRISFPFYRHGIFLQYGVSRGHKVGNPRKKVDWLRAIYDHDSPEINEFADIVANYRADATVKTLR